MHKESQKGFGVFVYLLGLIVLMGLVMAVMTYNTRTNIAQNDAQVGSANLYQQFDTIRSRIVQCQVRYAAAPDGPPKMDAATTGRMQGEPNLDYPTCLGAGVSCVQTPNLRLNVLSLDILKCPADSVSVFPFSDPSINLSPIPGFGAWSFTKDSEGVYVSIPANNPASDAVLNGIQQTYKRLQPNEVRNRCDPSNPSQPNSVFSAYILRNNPLTATTTAPCATSGGTATGAPI
jgi:hypothetical protein